MASVSPEATMTGIVDAFRRLRSSDSRRRTLEALVRELNPYEWRAVHAVTGARSFQKDIVGQLPLELVALVFRYLDTSTPYRLQRVSRRWNHVLRSLSILRDSLNVWYGGAVDLSNADHALCERNARRIQRLRRGLPSNSFWFDLNFNAAEAVLVGSVLIWHPYNEPVIHVLRLDTWAVCSLRGAANERPHRFRASDELVAIMTYSNVCYVSMLDGQGRKSFTMPSRHFLLHACRGRTVALAACFDDHITVYIWSYDTQHGRAFDISHHPSHNFFPPRLPPHHQYNCTLLLQPDTETVVVIGAVVCKEYHDQCPYGRDERVLCGRFTYSGQCVHSAHLPPLDDEDMYPVSILHEWPIVPVHTNGRVHAVGMKFFSGTGVFQYDERVNNFTRIHSPHGDDLHTHPYMAWWNDIFYEIRVNFEFTKPDLVRISGTIPKQIVRGLISSERAEIEHLGSRMRHILLNEKYVIYFVSGGFYVHCFEQNNTLPPKNDALGDIREWELLFPFA